MGHPAGENREPQRTLRTQSPTTLSLMESALADLFAPGLQRLLHQIHELVGYGAVDEAVIVAESQVDDGADRDRVGTVLVGNHHGLLGDSADTHDRRIRLVDDGESEDRAELAGVGDGEGGAFDVLGFEFLGTGALAEIGDAALQAEEIQVARILEDGDDESPVEGDSDAHVDLAVITDVVAFEAGVDDRPLLQGDNGGPHEEWHEGEASAVALLESGFVLIAQIDDAGEVHLVHAVDVSAGAAGLDHALRDLPAAQS